ncbi:hypothetical protein PSPO01_04344 [Paraphaeosphaeria sporulosa]
MDIICALFGQRPSYTTSDHAATMASIVIIGQHLIKLCSIYNPDLEVLFAPTTVGKTNTTSEQLKSPSLRHYGAQNGSSS